MGRRVAVLADVHGNLVALRAVLADAAAAGAAEVVVAGDVVNFGPQSDAVVDLLWEAGARLIRGNHEQELVAPYGTPALPPRVATSPAFALARWTLEGLGPAQRASLAALPDLLHLDAATVVAHGSPRHARDAVTAERTDEELAAMLDGSPEPLGPAAEPVRLAFVGHTHRPLLRSLPGPVPRRFVNVGAVGFNLDGDPRACYALAERGPSGAPGDWRVELRRVPYDVAAAVAAFENGFRQACPDLAELLARQVRTARPYFGPWLRASADLPEEALLESARRYLAAHP
jgi:diadenosine tetraphosphatase ApaH/serine/threonine PP2A family protein phosphatase